LEIRPCPQGAEDPVTGAQAQALDDLLGLSPVAVLVEQRQVEMEAVLAEDSVKVERRHMRLYGPAVHVATG